MSTAGGSSWPQLDPQNPWPGLASYDESSQAFFSGRRAESDELLRRIVDESVTVLFGKSGLGKSSLLKAGVFPRLRDKGYLPVFVRLQVRPGAAPLVEQLCLAFFEALRAQEVTHEPLAAGQSLWAYLHTPGLEFWTRLNRMARPVFVLDQFEELFTLGRSMPAEVATFREALADLAENRIPAAFVQRLKERAGSDEDIDKEAMPYKIVLSLREDFLADLEGWRPIMPSLRRNRMRLLPMGTDQALQAVCNEHTDHLVDELLAHRIVAFLSRGAADETDVTADAGAPRTVEPALLSLFCRGVNEHRKLAGAARITEAMFEGEKDTIVTGFYRRSLKVYPDRVRHFVEEKLITEHGYRNSYSVDDAIVNGFVTAEEIAALVDGRLLRQEQQHGTDRVELTHDILTKAALEERDRRRADERALAERRQRSKLRRVIAVSGVMIAVFFGLALSAYFAKRDAQAERSRAQSRELAALAGTAQDPEVGVLLSLEGLKRADTSEARSALLASGQYLWPSETLSLEQLGGEARVVALNPDGDLLAVLAGTSSLSVWDLSEPVPRKLWSSRPDLDDAMFIAFSPDQTKLAVARAGSVDLFDSRSGTLARSLPQTAIADRALLVFSPDGRWLASIQKDDHIWIWDYRDPTADVMKVAAEGLLVIGLSQDGKVIVGAGVKERLFAKRIERQPNGNWVSTPIDFTRCLEPKSISPGAKTSSANFRATTCEYTVAEGNEPLGAGTSDNSQIYDVVWSPGGGAFVEYLDSGDIVVAEERPSAVHGEIRIKGAEPRLAGNNAGLFSVTDDTARVAIVAHDGVVHVYSTSKLLLSILGDPRDFDALPDGRWVVLSRRDKAWIDVIEVPATGGKQVRQTRIPLPGEPVKLRMTRDGIVAVVSKEQRDTTYVLDPSTGANRFAPVAGRVSVLGRDGELLLVADRQSGQAEVIRTRDGAVVTPWKPQPGSVRSSFIASPSGTALGVLRRSAADLAHAELAVYAVRDEQLVPTGQIVDLPPRATAKIDDDGQSAIVTTHVTGDVARVWPLSASAPTNVKDVAKSHPAAKEAASMRVSPLGRFEIQSSPDEGRNRTRGFEVVRRPGGALIKRLGDSSWKFSSDDRWLAYWNAKGVSVLDLASGDTAFSLDFAIVRGVDFNFRNNILAIRLDSGTMLVPLDRAMMERFARSLTKRELSAQEKCAYGLGDTNCREQVAISRTRGPAQQSAPGKPAKASEAGAE
ncbi:nSTAND1 domain-containing NTPase [Caballeronia telluris]|uniref:Novel STAND NTPase 1 domain-containing protein n=1 Tax=Caballeronia telluris TaxID=326475 RepID=A0A158H8Y1_9BURK|nr:hypothetical protein [Caballeronia telluris]SAL40852.1 hypothetical protein AWB66_02101 [Caballeronia telluris]